MCTGATAAGRSTPVWFPVVLLPALLCSAFAQIPDKSDDFFEKRVRPVLAKNCFACHTNAQLGGLRLDSEAAFLKGGKSGPAIIAGDAAGSLLMQAVRQTHPRLKMPPQGRLRSEELVDLAAWIDRGAHWPKNTSSRNAVGMQITPEQRQFWSFQPIRQPAIPSPADKLWPRTNIDKFLLVRMEAEHIAPSPAADKRTLIRRVTFDLTGLPPASEEIAAFVADNTPTAFEKVVDRLLNSPHYGERWARHWLDLARYSDGQQSARDDSPFANAFRYRDWVVDAFNSDMPFDVFVKAQIAADQMAPDMRDKLLPGLGFQAIGETNNDRVDVTTRVFLGLTVGCAQCHNHKFDPIPTADYYSLLGVFESSRVDEHPLVGPEIVDKYKAAKNASEQRQAELKLFLERQVAQVTDVLASQTEQYVMAAWRLIQDPNRKPADVAGPDQLDVRTLENWVRYLKQDKRDHPFMAGWDELRKRQTVTEEDVRPIAQQIHRAVQDVLREKAAIDDRNYVKLGGIAGMKDTDKVISTLVDALPIERYYFWRDIASRPYKVEDLNFAGGIYYYGPKEVDRFLSERWQRYLKGLRADAKGLESAIPPAYPFWHVMADTDKPHNIKIAVRGDVSNPGEEVPRHFLAVLSEGEPKPFSKGSGRMELAEAIASPKNPLTARVMVNRIWAEHFGEGIVRSLSNFGQMGDRPSHPELLDYLANRFIESGWSVKAIQREIVLSAAYRMSSAEQPGKQLTPRTVFFPRSCPRAARRRSSARRYPRYCRNARSGSRRTCKAAG